MTSKNWTVRNHSPVTTVKINVVKNVKFKSMTTKYTRRSLINADLFLKNSQWGQRKIKINN